MVIQVANMTGNMHVNSTDNMKDNSGKKVMLATDNASSRSW